MVLYRIVAKHFVAGFEYNGKYVWRAAPIIKYMHGYSLESVKAYCKRKQWALEEIEI